MHTIDPTDDNLYGYFSRDVAPILTINSGETVRYSTLAANWTYYDADKDELVKHEHSDPDERRVQGHAMCGPIAINGAKKGMVLEVSIDKIVPDKRGFNRGGGYDWEYWKRLGVAEEPAHLMDWTIDVENNTATSSNGYTVQTAPFLGVIGMPPDEDGKHITAPPRYCGGNIDCKLLVEGSRLFLPISVDRALVSVGDGHAAQGDGEASGTAIECPMQQVDLTFTLHTDMTLTTPRAYTPSGWITLGVHEDLDEAMLIALNAMLDHMQSTHDLTRKDALALASVVVDLHITQVVNGVQGVHALLPHDALKKA